MFLLFIFSYTFFQIYYLYLFSVFIDGVLPLVNILKIISKHSEFYMHYNDDRLEVGSSRKTDLQGDSQPL